MIPEDSNRAGRVLMKILRELLIRILLVGLGLAVAFVGFEAAVRVLDLYRFPSDLFVEPHPELGWFHIPKKEGYWKVGGQSVYVKISSKGLRDREYAYEKQERTFRILVLGDSFTEGFQVPLEDCFTKVLEYELTKLRGRFEVINCGFGGAGTNYELLFCRKEGFKYDPDLVVLAFFAGNDVQENYRSHKVLENKRSPLAYETGALTVRLKHFLAQNSCAYNYLGIMLPRQVPGVAKLFMKIGLLSSQPLDDIRGVDQLHYLVFLKKYGPEWEKAWKVTETLISELKTEVENHERKLAVVSIPMREQVCPNVWKDKSFRPAMARLEWDLVKPDRILGGILSEAEIPFLELLPYFSEAQDRCQLYHGEDGHWNVDGHRLAGQVIYDWLVKEELVPINGEGSTVKGET